MDFVKFGIGWIIAIVFGLVTVYSVFGNRRKSLEYFTDAKSLIGTELRDHRGQLQVSFNGGGVIDNPYILDFSICNAGRRDVGSNDFDANNALEFAVGAQIVSRLQASGESYSQAIDLDHQNQLLKIGPTKLAAGVEHTVRVLLDGKPRCRLGKNPMIDTSVTPKKDRIRRERRRTLGVIIVSIVLFLFSTITNATLVVQQEPWGLKAVYRGMGMYSIESPTWAVVLQWIDVTSLLLSVALLIYAYTRVLRTDFRGESLSQAIKAIFAIR